MRSLALAALVVLAAACVTPEPAPPPPPTPPADRPAGESIVVCGELVHVGAPVVTWRDPGGYSAYSTELCFPDETPSDPSWKPPAGLRYRPGRETEAGRVTRRSTPAELARVVDQLVLHYDVCGTSRTCFKVLHDRRELSVHFLLDLDGTLYQTLDLADTAWHARQANPRSIGIEIANIGAYPPGAPSPLDEFYTSDARGTVVSLPARLGDGGVRTAGFVARPVRAERVRGVVNGRALEMMDYTPEQYATLARLAAALCRIFPRIAPDVPRTSDGRARIDALSDAELAAFGGILGHQHVTSDKTDPGPAFDWEWLPGVLRAGP